MKKTTPGCGSGQKGNKKKRKAKAKRKRKERERGEGRETREGGQEKGNKEEGKGNIYVF